MGSSGAGKSTLIRMLNGSLLPSDGQVYLLGQDAASLKGRQLRRLQSQIGTIYQQFHLVDTLQVVHNVNAGHLGEWSFLKSAVSLVQPLEITRAYSALERVGIPEKLYAAAQTSCRGTAAAGCHRPCHGSKPACHPG